MILGQGPKVEQFKLIGYTLYRYIWNIKKSGIYMYRVYNREQHVSIRVV